MLKQTDVTTNNFDEWNYYATEDMKECWLLYALTSWSPLSLPYAPSIPSQTVVKISLSSALLFPPHTI